LADEQEVRLFGGRIATFKRRVPIQISKRASKKKPEWRPQEGILRFQGRRIGTFQIRRPPTTYDLVLSAFQRGGWRQTVPAPDEIEAAELYGVLSRMTKKVKLISFHVHMTGKAMRWQRKSPRR
jgi:hypothetical protein